MPTTQATLIWYEDGDFWIKWPCFLQELLKSIHKKQTNKKVLPSMHMMILAMAP